MRMFKNIRIVFAAAAFFIMQTAYAFDNHVPVRVGISDTAFQTYLFDGVEFNDLKDIQIMDEATGYFVPLKDTSLTARVAIENNLFRIYLDNELVAKNLSGPVLVSSKTERFISIAGLKRKGRQAAYRGCIELTKSGTFQGKFVIVNVISLKNYLRGVVPNEMPVKFGLEALKAQTVAARNYAIAPRTKAFQEFDVCDSVACQVYFGANTEEALSDKAIEQTNGIIALDNQNNPILALYSSTAGGYTESYENVFSDPVTKSFPSKYIHYLIATPDRKEFPLLNTNEAAERFYTENPESFDDQSPYYRWSKDWTLPELNEILLKTLPAQSKTGFIHPAVNDKSEIGTLKSISVLERGNSGKIIKLAITTDKNTFIVEKELVIRRCFPKNGISLPSANFVITYINSKIPVYKFSGGGFGHGTGMSQWGAGKMAALGFTFDRILKHYYSGIKLASIPVEIHSGGKITERRFYTELKDARVYIDNTDKIQKLKIFINGKEINIKLNGENQIVDISEYLEQGQNRISYQIQDKIDYDKKMRVFIVSGGTNNE